MQAEHVFVINSDSSGHRPSLDGHGVATFPTLNEAEAKAFQIARLFNRKATLRFEVDFKWTLSDLELRMLTGEAKSTANAVDDAQQAEAIALNRYKGGQRMVASVGLVRAVGGSACQNRRRQARRQ